MKERITLFIAWYKKLKEDGIRMYGEDQSDLDWYVKYNTINCIIWAVNNSAHYDINGSYLYKYSQCGKHKERIH
jgi:hypothetical protein